MTYEHEVNCEQERLTYSVTFNAVKTDNLVSASPRRVAQLLLSAYNDTHSFAGFKR